MYEYMKISDVPVLAAEYDDYIFARCSFLDDFYECDISEKALLLKDEPIGGILSRESYCDLAAMAHKLSNDYSLPIPSWVMKDEYVMLNPEYYLDTKKESVQEILREISPPEYKMRNLFLGANILTRK